LDFRYFFGVVSLRRPPHVATLALAAETQKVSTSFRRTQREANTDYSDSSKAATTERSRVKIAGTEQIRSRQGDIAMSTAQVPTLDMNKLNAFIGQFVTDLGASVHAGMVVIGEKLGLYKALAQGTTSSSELAAKTSTDERYLREWLASQAAGGYITYDERSRKFSLTEEQAFTLAQEDSPAYLPGAFELALGSLAAVPRIAESFRTGAGMGWHEHDDGVFHGCEKFFRPGYAANLVNSWIPSLDDVKQKLEAGARVADVGCGKGASTLLLAKAYPKSKFFGFDYHDKSIDAARDSAKQQGLNDRVSFEVSKAKDFPGKDYDLVAVFDCLHDMGDPVGAATHVRRSLAKDGTWMIVEPFANDELKDNLNPVGRVYYSFSTLLCTPCSRSQEVGLCLGAQAGEKRIREVVTGAGFSRFRRANETPFNIIYEARP
jgi:ubiquinone/menaquinone biosynthesis C-methylase UbiE